MPRAKAEEEAKKAEEERSWAVNAQDIWQPLFGFRYSGSLRDHWGYRGAERGREEDGGCCLVFCFALVHSPCQPSTLEGQILS